MRIPTVAIDIGVSTLEPTVLVPRVGDYVEPGVRVIQIWDDSYTTAFDEPEEEAANVAKGAIRFY